MTPQKVTSQLERNILYCHLKLKNKYYGYMIHEIVLLVNKKILLPCGSSSGTKSKQQKSTTPQGGRRTK